jgi:hypothetical protein
MQANRMTISNFIKTTFVASVLVFSSAAFRASNENGSDSAAALGKGKAILATELPPTDQFKTTPSGSGGSECMVDQPFQDGGEP